MDHEGKCLNSKELAKEIHAFTEDCITEIVQRYLADFDVPNFFNAYPIGSAERADLAYDLALLKKLGTTSIAGWDISEAISKVIKGIDGETTTTFYSYRTAEALLPFGKAEGNEILKGFTDEQRQNIYSACDSTSIYDAETNELSGYSNNYYAVLARCEEGRRNLGILEDESIFNTCIEKVNAVFEKSVYGFFDDSPTLMGRYDIYSADTFLFLEPMWQYLDKDLVNKSLKQHADLLKKSILPNGAMIAWGRSTGALSVCIAIELAAAALAQDIDDDRAHYLSIINHSFTELKSWFSDGLVNAHRGKMTYGYRGPQRLLQMTLDIFGKLAYSAICLQESEELTEMPIGLFGDRDDYIPFNSNNAGLWCYKNNYWQFQFPIVSGTASDYLPFFKSPNLIDCPVDSKLHCGVPRIQTKDGLYLSCGIPDSYEKTEQGLRLNFSKAFDSENHGETGEPVNFSRKVNYQVDKNRIHVTEEWRFDDDIKSINYIIPESDRKFNISVDCDVPVHRQCIETTEMFGWQSFWGQIQRIHEFNFELSGTRSVCFSYTIHLVPRVFHLPWQHDYNRALYDAIGDRIDETGKDFHVPFSEFSSALANQDILHIGWPEHAFEPGDEDDSVEKLLGFVEGIGDLDLKVFWTMHNALPHYKRDQDEALYDAWAKIVDGVAHHSDYGMKRMKATLPYKDSAKHIVSYHGHYGEQMQTPLTRAECEAKRGLPDCVIRYAVIGRAQKEKQVQLIIDAFHKTDRDDIQLYLTATDSNINVPDDARIFAQPNNAFIEREEISEQAKVCDCFVSAHDGERYLTSGTVADAVGLGAAMLNIDWEYLTEICGDMAISFNGTEADLQNKFQSITVEEINQSKEKSKQLQEKYSWPAQADKIHDLIETLYRDD
ncbi:MAG: hypothetical protein HRT89_02785 [Lentisphaeria bacterium]|nr:hypothetical protein [Lentisphaeria bacterium]NQZ66975.1 hypothetical protein [Lentisphaeria bacterium]